MEAEVGTARYDVDVASPTTALRNRCVPHAQLQLRFVSTLPLISTSESVGPGTLFIFTKRTLPRLKSESSKL